MARREVNMNFIWLTFQILKLQHCKTLKVKITSQKVDSAPTYKHFDSAGV